jgi:exodeoxyribonuclease VII large subunit
VALAVAQSPIPVVSGVGHETDFTVVDFVADLRAPTPTAAAEAAVRGCVARQELLGTRLLQQQQRIRQRVEQERRGLMRLSVRLQRLHPQRRLDQLRQLLDERERRLHRVARQTLVQRGEQQLAALQRLDALNPLRVLGRGYSIVQNAGGGVVTGPAEVAAGEKLTVQSAGGSYGVAVLQPATALPAALGILEREQE